mmetsp:Transcript_373/g.924  ORF Transcript_373/g.924 Transcript_373/m.924 type:complete len:214 (-) Transcript_373:457-1098(-)
MTTKTALFACRWAHASSHGILLSTFTGSGSVDAWACEDVAVKPVKLAAPLMCGCRPASFLAGVGKGSCLRDMLAAPPEVEPAPLTQVPATLAAVAPAFPVGPTSRPASSLRTLSNRSRARRRTSSPRIWNSKDPSAIPRRGGPRPAVGPRRRLVCVITGILASAVRLAVPVQLLQSPLLMSLLPLPPPLHVSLSFWPGVHVGGRPSGASCSSL